MKYVNQGAGSILSQGLIGSSGFTGCSALIFYLIKILAIIAREQLRIRISIARIRYENDILICGQVHIQLTSSHP